MTTAPRLSRAALTPFDDDAQHIAGRQYLQAGDGDIGGMFERIARWVAGAEAPEARLGWAQKYYDLMAGKKFCPGGRVLAGAGTQHGNVLNCLQGDTLVETQEGQKRIADLSGTVNILSQGGVYRSATFGSYGRQELYRVLLSNGETLEATAGHRWPVGKPRRGHDRTLTTLELVGQHLPIIPTKQRPQRDEDYRAGLQHGIVYGDGSRNTNGHTHHVQLFGNKRALAQFFPEHRVHDAVYSEREVTVAQGMRGALKVLPDELCSDSYWYGFFSGLLATDGGLDDRGSAAIYQSDAEELSRLARQLVRFGVKTSSIRLFRHADGGYGGKPAYALRLIKQTLLAEDFVREDQRSRFESSFKDQTQPRNASLQVMAVEATGRSENVYCCDEPETHTFVIQGGLLTGNCFVQGATEHAPSSFEGVMEVARKLALVTKVGGGNGVNLDVYTPRAATSRPDAGVRGWVYMAAWHPDVSDFVLGLMRPPTQPDGDKQPVAIRNWTRVVYGQVISAELVALARQNGVQIVRALPEGVKTVPDDMGGIIDAARSVAETARLELEPRLDLSQMRPEGAAIQGSGGTSSGPVSFLMEIFDNFLEWANRGAQESGPVNTLRYVYSPVLRVVRQGGTRRGAGMATISVSHPDVLDFLTAKDLDREASEGDISTFNISLLVDEAFWNTLQAGGVWPLAAQEVPGKYYLAEQAGDFAGSWPDLPQRGEDGAKGVPIYTVGQQSGIPAAWLWDQVAQHAWSTGEPGLIFVDRINEYSALRDLGERYQIRSTNPCVTGDTLVAVADGRGAVSFRELAEADQDVPVYTKTERGDITVRWMRNPRVTGYAQPIYRVSFDDGLKVRVTGNHKFNLTDGTVCEALALQPGDSVASMTRFEGNFDDAFGVVGKRSQDYAWLTSGQGQPRGEHRLMAAFEAERPLRKGAVVHHQGDDGLNNYPSNLALMTREAHDELHRTDMLGDNNPMRERWWGQLDEAARDAYRARMSEATSGERNGRHSGLRHPELEAAARELALSLGRGFTNREWQAFARERALPQSFSEHRSAELDSVNALSERVASELGLPALPRGVGQSRQAVHNFDLYQSALTAGYVAVRHEGNFYPIVTRACEDCGLQYEQVWDRREVSYCRPCGLRRASAAGRTGARAARRRVSENTAQQQVRAFNDLKFKLGRRPLKQEWEAQCREASVPIRLHPGGLPTYAALTERASVANHRVVSVEYVGIEDVYNGTVDELHNYYIGHHEVSKIDEKRRFSYVNTQNCGEIPLTVGEPCDLGAINLAAYVEHSQFDFAAFRADVHTCVRFLDDVLDVNVFALEDNRVASQDLRRLGLGVMGLADALIKLGLRYDSAAGREMISEIMSALREEAVAESERLGEERGIYPVSERHAEQMPHTPRRNVAVLTVAPTGTTSMLMGVSSGIEPVFSPFIWRKIGSEYRALLAPLFVELLESYPPAPNMSVPDQNGGGKWDWDRVTQAVSENHGSVVGLSFIPAALQQVFVCAHDIAPLDHVRMQGAVQRAFDASGFAANSLSKCIAAGTLIPTNQGLIAIEEFAHTPKDDTFTALDGSLTVDGHRVTQHYRAGLKAATRITLDNGAALTGATASHRVMTANGWRLMAELKAGDMVLGKFLASHGAGGLGIEWTDHYRTNALPTQTPKAMTPSLAKFLGMLAADGHTIEITGNVGLTCKDEEVETEFVRLCQSIFGLTPRRIVDQRNGVVALSLTSRNLARYIEALIGKGAYHKHIPHQILRGSAQEKQAFLEGLTLDGYVWEGGLCLYAGMSQKLAYQAAELARSFGLPKIYQGQKWVKSTGKVCYLVSVSNELQEILRPIESRKKVPATRSWYRVHVPAQMIAATQLNLAHVGYSNFRSIRLRGVQTCKNTSAEQIGWDTDVLAYRVTAVEDAGTVEMFDIEVEGSHAYVVNGMISHNTINLPNSATVQDVQDAYGEAYTTGCKGITVYRDGSRQFQVLSTSKTKDKAEDAQPETVQPDPLGEAAAEVMGETPTPEALPAPRVSPAPQVGQTQTSQPPTNQPQANSTRNQPRYERPARLQGITDMVKLTDPTSGHRRSFLVTVNHLGGNPVEVMVISGRAGDEANADSEALGRVVSIALQHGVPAEALIKTLRGINGGLYGSYNGRLVGSKADLIAVALESFAKDLDLRSLPPLSGGSGESRVPGDAPGPRQGVSTEGLGQERCPVCGEKAVIREEGCLKCQACGYSKCG